VPDAIRAYGIGWDMVTNFTVYDENIYLSGFFFTYDEAIGIPAESDKLIYELVFDARELVGSDSIPNIPEELFAHEGLTLCGINCDCDTVPDNAKEIINVCMNNSTHSPADAFIPETPFVYELIFHVNDGWEIPSFLNNFDFVLSDTPFETINIAYVRELNVISVRLGVFCGDDGKLEAGEHTCVKQRMDEVAPTCTENGRIAHFACYCGKAYADRWGFQEIGDSEDVTLNALGHSFGNEWLSDADNHWKACDCGEIAQKGTHSDANGNGSCDICGIRLNSVGEDTETEETDGGAVDYESESNGEDKDETGDIGIADEGPLGVGAIIGIVVGSAVILGIGVFAVIWFAVKKKSFADLIRKK